MAELKAVVKEFIKLNGGVEEKGELKPEPKKYEKKVEMKDSKSKIKNPQPQQLQSQQKKNSKVQHEEYIIKINKLEKYIQELELKIKQKDKKINEEKIKNYKLNKEIKELKNINSKTNDVKELENEIKLFRSYYNYTEGEKLISINFISVSQDINFNIISKNTEKFSKIENLLYDKYPKYLDLENYFLVHGNKINTHRTLKENKINNNDIITLGVNSFD